MQSFVLCSFCCGACNLVLQAHVLDPAYVRRAGAELVKTLSTPAGAAVLARASRRLGELGLVGVEVEDREAFLRLAGNTLPREILGELARGSLVEDAAEVLAFFGGEEGPDNQAQLRIREQSLATFHLLRRLRARWKREFKMEPALKPLPLPHELRHQLEAKSAPEIEVLRRRWCKELLPRGLSKQPLQAPIARFDLDGDGHAEVRAVDADLDGKHDRFEGDLDGDRIFETLFTRKDAHWSAADDPAWRATPR